MSDLASLIAKSGVGLTFVPSNARLNLLQADDGGLKRSIGMTISLNDHDDVRLPDSRSLKGVKWTIHLREGAWPQDGAENQSSVGALHYIEADYGDYIDIDEHCAFDVAITPDRFSTLLSSLLSGRLPNYVQIKAHGMSYGHSPDGSEKLWDVQATPHVSVSQITFGIPLATAYRISPDMAEETDCPDSLPAMSGDIRALQSNLLHALTNARNESSLHLKAIFWLLIVVSALFYFHK